MMENEVDKLPDNYQNMISQISETYFLGQRKAASAVNSNMVETYWKIGRHIVEFELGGKIKAKYGKALKDDLLVQYAMHNILSQLFVNKHQLYLPDKDELRQLIENRDGEQSKVKIYSYRITKNHLVTHSMTLSHRMSY